MKTWEMIRELQENPNKKFESECWNVVKMINNVLYWEAIVTCMGGEVKVNNDFFNAEWEEVRESLSFIDAVKTGKNIKPCIILPTHPHGEICGVAKNLKDFQLVSEVLYSLSDYDDKQIMQYVTNIKWDIE